LACRIQTIQAAAAGGALPECAGGAPMPKLSLQKATAISESDIVVNFSIAVDNETGSNAANYTLTPDAKITKAVIDSGTGFIVKLTAALTAGTEYELKVKNLVSIIGTGLDPAHTTTKFTAPKTGKK
jgi:hypothetical protein